MRKTWIALGLLAGLTGATTVWAADETSGGTASPEQQSQDADQGTMEDTLQSPAEETMGSPSEESKTEEAVVPSSGQVAGTVKSLDMKTGYFSVETAQGAMKLHADPTMLKDKGVKEGDQVTASVEKRGEMNHVTSLMMGKGGETEKSKGAY